MANGSHPAPPRARAEVCLSCGSLHPERIEPDCTHPDVAQLVELRPQLADLLAKIRRAREFQAGALRALGEAIEAERLAGRANMLRDPAVDAPAGNVRFLRPRDVFVPDPEDSPPSARPLPSSPTRARWAAPPAAPSAEPPRPPAPAGPPLTLTSPEPKSRRTRGPTRSPLSATLPADSEHPTLPGLRRDE